MTEDDPRTTPTAVVRDALDGLRVTELGSGRSSSMVGMVLADFGAKVTKVLPPPDLRPRPGGIGHPSTVQWDRGKKGLTLDLRIADEVAQIRSLIAESDVVVDGHRSTVLTRRGITPVDVCAQQPNVIYCTIRGIDQPSPWSDLPGYDASVLALAGRMLEMGQMLGLGRPAYVPVPLASFGAAQGALQGILAALHERSRSGRGQLVEASLLRAVTTYDIGSWLAGQFRGGGLGDAVGSPGSRPRSVPPPSGDTRLAGGRGTSTPLMGYLVACTKDGRWVQFANWAPHLFWAQVEALGLGHLRADSRFAGLPLSSNEEGYVAFWEAVLSTVRTRSSDAWISLARAEGRFGVDVVYAPGEGMDHPQVRHNGDVIELFQAPLGPVLQLAPIATLEATPAHPGRIPGPAVDRTSSSLAAPDGTTGSSITTPVEHEGALSDLTVLDLASWFAAPYGPSLLAELGARVIKVEPLSGDPMRQNQILAVKTQQGKESLAIDLKHPRSREIFERLVRMADVIVQNFRPGVAERLGADYESVRAINDRIIYVEASGYGADGPYAGVPAYHPTAGAVCGQAMLQAGRGWGAAPTNLGDMDELKRSSLRLAYANEGHPDPASALVVATAVLLAVSARDRHGCGQAVRTSMLRSNAYLMIDCWIRTPEGPVPTYEPDPELLGLHALHRLYRCSEGWVFLACPADAPWRRLCEALGAAELSQDLRFATADEREARSDDLAALLTERFLQRTADFWERVLLRAEVCCVRADRGGTADVLSSDHNYRTQEVIVDTVHPELGPHWRYGSLVRLSRSAAQLGPGTRIGQHTRMILREMGYSPDHIDSLRAAKIVGEPDLPV